MLQFSEIYITHSRLAVTLAALLCFAMAGSETAAADPSAARRSIAPEYDGLRQQAAERGGVPVLVRFSTDLPDGRSLAERREAGRDRLRKAMARKNLRAFAEFRRSGLSAFFVNPSQLDQLIDSGFVESVRESKPRKAHLIESNELIDTAVARTYGLYGDGTVVVVLDTGIDAGHSTFDDRVVWEACFSTNWAAYSATNLCPAGGTANATQYFQSGSGAAALSKCTDVECWHGTHTTSIAAGSDPMYTGIAPEAGIIAIQVFSRFNSSFYCGGSPPCILSFDHDQLSALEYVADLATNYNVASVNMSLGGGSYSAVCDSTEPNFVPIIDDLAALGIVVAASSGNDYSSNTLGHPACLSKVVSVGSVIDTTDAVSTFSNGAPFLDLLAPGEWTTAAYPGQSYASARGTSMAAPHVAGAVALLKSAKGSLTHADIRSLLVDNGTPVLDGRNGLTFPRLDLGLATLALFDGLAGDADDDGDVDAADLLLVQRHIIGAAALDTTAIFRCDLHPAGDPDAVLDVADLILLEQLLQAP